MRRLKFLSSTPPGGYHFSVPFSNEEIVAGDLAQLVQKTRIAYARNKIVPPTDLAARIEHFICLHTDASVCAGEYEPGDVQSRIGNVVDIRNSISEISNVRLKMPLDQFLVPQEVAEKRAATCAACVCNTLGFCTSCHQMSHVVVKALEGRKTSVDKKLGICGVCSCYSAARVHISKAALQLVKRPPNEGEYPVECWLRVEGIR